MSPRRVVHDRLSAETTENDDEKVLNVKSYREVISGVVIMNYVAVSVTVTVLFSLEFHYRNRSHSPIITIETFCWWMVAMQSLQ